MERVSLKKKLKKKNIYKHKHKNLSSKSKIQINLNIFNVILIIIKCLFLFLLIRFIIKINLNNNGKQKHKNIENVDMNGTKIINDVKYDIYSEKWIIINAFNPPSKTIIDLENMIDKWKIIVIGNNKTNNSNWDMFKNSTKLIYLSIKDQNLLGYNILKFLNVDSYCRKNIGYLFAIQHGAKEIYEIDENLEFSMNNLTFFDFNINDSYICYGQSNNSKMINPYIHFGETNIWPRGFLYKDIISEYNKTIRYTHSSKIKLEPLVYQGLINGIPDVDSLFILTHGKISSNLNITFSNNPPLLYLPGNYVPLNSKNTKYFYEIFPFLMLPMTINESISDILRGYILERFVYAYNGSIVYNNNTDVYNSDNFLNNINNLGERDILFCLDKILDIIKSDKHSVENSKTLLFSIISELIKNNFLKKEELDTYHAFLDDLTNIGYNFSSNFTHNVINDYNNYLNISTELIYYIPKNPILLKGNNTLEIIKHSSCNKVYNDILLIINYNIPGFLELNKYLEKLYKKYFPNIVYLYPGKSEKDNPNIFECKESKQGYYSYICIKYVYNKFPNYKGYLLTNDDNYMKVWELENFDFSIPWYFLYEQFDITWRWMFYNYCKNLYNICDNNPDWKEKVINFYGMYKIFSGLTDFYYIPNNYMINYIELIEKMYDSKIFLECAVHTSFAIMSAPKYQVIRIRALYAQERIKAINFLQKEFEQIFIHPIKFSKDEFRIGVNKYNYFINSNEF